MLSSDAPRMARAHPLLIMPPASHWTNPCSFERRSRLRLVPERVLTPLANHGGWRRNDPRAREGVRYLLPNGKRLVDSRERSVWIPEDPQRPGLREAAGTG